MVKTKYKEEREHITEARHDEEKSQDPKKSDYILFLVSLIGGAMFIFGSTQGYDPVYNGAGMALAFIGIMGLAVNNLRR